MSIVVRKIFILLSDLNPKVVGYYLVFARSFVVLFKEMAMSDHTMSLYVNIFCRVHLIGLNPSERLLSLAQGFCLAQAVDILGF